MKDQTRSQEEHLEEISLLKQRIRELEQSEAQSKLVERELRESEERIRLITETIDEVFWMADVEIGRMFYVSPGFERIWGRSRESLYENPQSFLDAVHTEDRDRVLADYELKKTGQPFEHEYRIVQPDGNIRCIWDRGFPIQNENEKISSYAGVAMDITARKNAETESRERAQRLEEANVALKVLLRHREEDRRDLEEQFLANLRKLIMPSLEKLRQSDLTPRQSTYVDVVEMNVRKIFSPSRADAGLSYVNFTPVEMRIFEFIKGGKTTKEIAKLLNISPRTVEYYRDKIRKKLGLTSKNVNLRSYLYTLP